MTIREFIEKKGTQPEETFGMDQFKWAGVQSAKTARMRLSPYAVAMDDTGAIFCFKKAEDVVAYPSIRRVYWATEVVRISDLGIDEDADITDLEWAGQVAWDYGLPFATAAVICKMYNDAEQCRLLAQHLRLSARSNNIPALAGDKFNSSTAEFVEAVIGSRFGPAFVGAAGEVALWYTARLFGRYYHWEDKLPVDGGYYDPSYGSFKAHNH